MILGLLAFGYLLGLAIVDMVLSKRWSEKTISVGTKLSFAYRASNYGAWAAASIENTEHPHIANLFISAVRIVATVFVMITCIIARKTFRKNIGPLEFTDDYVQGRYNRALYLIAAAVVLAFIA